ncbi:MAG: VIT1/CCC1 family protein [Candidatus Thermoplasmatota archaeon]|nr:VIT1/CCC1 family protein [Candidatus Thermoplasmatota archaeon]MCL5730623.1 VIT1/CCC1 family protein [Candidatus Thermoplasmatota archaeon]
MMDEVTRLMMAFYRDELTDQKMYERLAVRSRDDEFRKNLIRLADVEKYHSGFWRDQLIQRGMNVARIHYRRLKLFFILLISRIVGEYLSVRLLEYGEYKACNYYSDFIKRGVGDDAFRKSLSSILEDELEHEDIFENRIEKTQEQLEKNRNIVYGMSDGLVEILAAVSGLTAIITSGYIIGLSGLVVGVGGTLSMALGAFLSKASETDYKITEIKKKSLFKTSTGDGERIRSYRKQGVASAYTTGLFYIIGALIPVLPFFVLPRIDALITAVVLVGASQFITNAIIALSMSVDILRPSLRATILTMIVAASTYLVGQFFHVFLHISIV